MTIQGSLNFSERMTLFNRHGGMSKITARYIDTCLSDYLRDSCNRPGQALALCSLGSSIEDTVQELLGSVSNLENIPECYEDQDLELALLAAIEGVDLRYIDEDGNRQDEPDEDRDEEEPYLYVVLEWDASKVTMVMTVEVDYLLNGTDPQDLKYRLEDIVRQGSANGAMTGGLDASVSNWGATASPKGEQSEAVALTYVLNQLEAFKPSALHDMGLLVAVEKLKALLGIESPAAWISTVGGWSCNKCGETVRELYKEPHGC